MQRRDRVGKLFSVKKIGANVLMYLCTYLKSQ